MKNKAKLVLAEAEVPKAMAEAFRSGNIGIMDYYRMKNVVADTRHPDRAGSARQSGLEYCSQEKEGTAATRTRAAPPRSAAGIVGAGLER
jgi:hypothetical protein